MNGNFNKNAKVQQLTEMLGRVVSLIVIVVSFTTVSVTPTIVITTPLQTTTVLPTVFSNGSTEDDVISTEIQATSVEQFSKTTSLASTDPSQSTMHLQTTDREAITDHITTVGSQSTTETDTRFLPVAIPAFNKSACTCRICTAPISTESLLKAAGKYVFHIFRIVYTMF